MAARIPPSLDPRASATLSVAFRARLPAGLDGIPECGQSRATTSRPPPQPMRCRTFTPTPADAGRIVSPRSAAWLGTTDLRDDLPGVQSAPVSWIRPASGGDAADSTAITDPLAYVNLIAHAHLRDAAVAAEPQLSAAALMPFDSRAGAAGVIFGLTAPRPSERWAGKPAEIRTAGACRPVRAAARRRSRRHARHRCERLAGSRDAKPVERRTRYEPARRWRGRPHAGRRGAQSVHRCRGRPAGRSGESDWSRATAHRSRIARPGNARSRIGRRAARIVPGHAPAGRSGIARRRNRRLSGGRPS